MTYYTQSQQCFHPGAVILLENLRFHIEEEGKGVDKDGKKVIKTMCCASLLCLTLSDFHSAVVESDPGKRIWGGMSLFSFLQAVDFHELFCLKKNNH